MEKSCALHFLKHIKIYANISEFAGTSKRTRGKSLRIPRASFQYTAGDTAGKITRVHSQPVRGRPWFLPISLAYPIICGGFASQLVYFCSVGASEGGREGVGEGI